MHLFSYGTLTFPEIWQAVLGDIIVGRHFPSIRAQAPNYEIYRVKNAVYPGIIATDSPTSDLRPLTSPSVPGLLYLNLTPEALARLDAFEDDFYVRQTITVICKDITCKGVICEGGRTLEAQAYVVPPESAHLLTNEPWTPKEFQARGHLAEFVSRYSGFNRLS